MGIENFPGAPHDFEEEVKQPVKKGLLSERDKNIIGMAETAHSSSKRAIQEMRLRALDGRLEDVKDAADWRRLNVLLEKGNMTEEEQDAVRYAVELLKSLKPLQNKEPLVKRSAKNIVDIATAFNVLKKSGECPESILDAAEGLFNAATEFASEKDVRAAAVILGGVMSEEEMRKAREHHKGLNIT